MVADAVARVPGVEWKALELGVAAVQKGGGMKVGRMVRVDVSRVTGEPSGWPRETVGREMGECAPV